MENKVIIFELDKKSVKYFVITDSFNKKMKEFMLENNINGILISKFHGFNMNSIDFLSDLEFIEDLRIIDINKIDGLNVINKLHNLKRLILSCEINTAINFNNFVYLDECSIYWNKYIQNLFQSRSLKKLMLRKYKDYDLSKLESLTELNLLSISHSSINNLDGISKLSLLQTLELSYMPNLLALNEILKLSNLKKLTINNSKKLDYWHSILKLSSLKWLGLAKLQSIDTLGDMGSLVNLEYFALIEGIKILDGDTSPLLELPKLKSVSLHNYKFYNYKSWDIEKLLNNKQNQ